MPNIIEQQDLLKGLPDDRLAAMMQAPTGDIPPFLVAAEAQRRQTIREQFSGGPQESVVDTLTKQLANVPQNIQAPAQQPPQMPPPDMGGVAALQGEQQMRDGGYVQRYQSAGLVATFPTRVQEIADQFGITVDQAAEMLSNNPSLSGSSAPEDYGRPPVISEQTQEPKATSFSLDLPSLTISPAELEAKRAESAREEKYQEMYNFPGYGSAQPRAASYNSYGKTGAFYRSAVEPKVPTPPTDPGKDATSQENKLKEYEAQLRAIGQIGSGDSAYIKGKLQELYGDNEASDWEKAQKWFAAAQAAIEPGQNNWQAAVNALSAFGGGMAEERAAERAGDRELAEALLKYEIADRQYRTETERDIAKDMMKYRISLAEAERDAAAARKAEQLGAYKFYTEGASGNIEAANLSIRSIMAERQEYIKSLPKDEVTGEPKIDPADPTLRAYDEQIKSYRDMISGAMAQRGKALQGYGRITGTDPSVTVFTGDGLATYNR